MKRFYFLLLVLVLSFSIKAQSDCQECKELERIITDSLDKGKFYEVHKQFYDGDFFSSYISDNYTIQELKNFVNSYMIPRIAFLVDNFEKLDDTELQSLYIRDLMDLYKFNPFDSTSLLLMSPWKCNRMNTKCSIGLIFNKPEYRYGIIITIWKPYADLQEVVLDISVGRTRL